MATDENWLPGKIKRGEVPARGVNLGGWLVAEHWMTWSSPIWNGVPEEIASKGEFATMQYLGHEEGDRRFNEHRAEWIKEEDIIEMKRYGLNMVRVPVGYWIQEIDPTDISNKQEWKVYAPHAISYLDRLVFDWCVKHEMGVLIDIHGAKGSQNGKDHSAPAEPGEKFWSQYPENVENTVQFACFLAIRYRYAASFVGLEMINEPEHPMDVDVLHNYYDRVYKAIRNADIDCLLITSPPLTEQHAPVMENFMRYPEYYYVAHDFHPYFIWGYEGQDQDDILDAVKGYKKMLKRWEGNWLFIGEWSCGSHASAFPAENRGDLRKFARAQLKAFKHAHAGWTFWSWRHSDDSHNRASGWSMRQLLRDGIIPHMDEL